MRAAAIFLAAALPAAAEEFRTSRGFSTDIWTEWMPLADRMAEVDFAYPDYPLHVTPGDLAALAVQGFDTMRLTADPGPLLALPEDARAARVRGLVARVREAQGAGLKVILDLHAYPAPGEPQDTATLLTSGFEVYLQLVGQVAGALDGLDPARTAFEPMNEPTIDCEEIASGAPQRWPGLMARIHAAARAAAPDLPLVLSGACWGGAWGLAALEPLPDPNVIWSFHSYEPFTFSHQGASWTEGPLVSLRDLPYPPERTPATGPLVAAALSRGAVDAEALAALVDAYRASPPDAVSAPLALAAAWADAQGIPRDRLLLGEFGALWRDEAGSEMDPESHFRFLADKRRAAEALGIGWIVWSFSGAMGITEASGPRLEPRTCAALGLACPEGTR